MQEKLHRFIDKNDGVEQGWMASDYLSCYDLYTLIFNDKEGHSVYENNEEYKNSIILCVTGHLLKNNSKKVNKSIREINLSLSNMLCEIPITTSRSSECKEENPSIKHLSNKLVIASLQSAIVSCVCVSTTFNGRDYNNTFIVPNEKGSTCIMPIKNYLFAVSLQLRSNCSCCICNNCKCCKDIIDGQIDVVHNNNNQDKENDNIQSIQSFLRGDSNSTSHAAIEVKEEIINNDNAIIDNQNQQYLVGRYVRRRINFNKGSNNFNTEKNLHNGITLTISHVPISSYKVKSHNDICTSQSIDIQLSIPLSTQYKSFITKVVNKLSFYDGNSDDSIVEMIHFLVAWCHLTGKFIELIPNPNPNISQKILMHVH